MSSFARHDSNLPARMHQHLRSRLSVDEIQNATVPPGNRARSTSTSLSVAEHERYRNDSEDILSLNRKYIEKKNACWRAEVPK